MNPQELLLFSDAIKIGFPVLGTIVGALIGGLTTYFLTKHNNINELKKEKSKRRFEMLAQTANDVAEFEFLIGSYATEVSNKIQGLKGAVNFEEARANVYTKNQPLRRARMTLKLLGLSDAEQHLESYLDITREVIKFGPNLTKERASELAKTIVAGPVLFYSSLAREFSMN
jgi:hypothetical protein